MNNKQETVPAACPPALEFARAMTWQEREDFIDAGLDPAYMQEEVNPEWERQAIKWIMQNLYADRDFSRMPFPECRRLAFRSYELTVKEEDEEIKNF